MQSGKTRGPAANHGGVFPSFERPENVYFTIDKSKSIVYDNTDEKTPEPIGVGTGAKNTNQLSLDASLTRAF
jgi:hypothetical protein